MSRLSVGLQTLSRSLIQPSAEYAKWKGLKEENLLKIAFPWGLKTTEWRACVSPVIFGADHFRVQWNH